MDALKKLQERNNKHANHKRNSIWSVVWGLCLLSPLFVSSGLEFYHSFKGLTFEALHPAAVLFAIFGFGLPLAFMGDLILLNRPAKLLLLVIAECWFIWFWVVTPLSWLAFLPLVPTYIWVKIQLSKNKLQT